MGLSDDLTVAASYACAFLAGVIFNYMACEQDSINKENKSLIKDFMRDQIGKNREINRRLEEINKFQNETLVNRHDTISIIEEIHQIMRKNKQLVDDFISLQSEQNRDFEQRLKEQNGSFTQRFENQTREFDKFQDETNTILNELKTYMK